MSRDFMNVNIGIIGHVDAGKTSLTAKLSSTLSTAALDKNPQSKERGITLDLGFSAFRHCVDRANTALTNLVQIEEEQVQQTIVDCPGHASLFKTVVAGSTIVDIFVMVVDVVEGIQPQTSEQFILAEILKSDKPIIFVINKIDKLDLVDYGQLDGNPKYLKLKNNIESILKKSRFNQHESIIIPTSAKLDQNILFIKDTLLKQTDKQIIPLKNIQNKNSKSNPSNLMHLNIDHIFVLKGKGYALTGTVLCGSININSMICPIHDPKSSFKVKSIQSFKKDINIALTGDRVGILVQGDNVDALKDRERHIQIAPAVKVHKVKSVLCILSRVPYYKSVYLSDSYCQSMHLGGQNVTCKLSIQDLFDENNQKLDFVEKTARNFFTQDKCKILNYDQQQKSLQNNPKYTKYLTNNNKELNVLKLKEWSDKDSTKIVQVTFNECINLTDLLISSDMVISKLDLDYSNSSKQESLCRLSLQGRILFSDVSGLKFRYSKPKHKQTLVHRLHDAHHIIVEQLFTKDVDERFVRNVQYWLVGDTGLKYADEIGHLNHDITSGKVLIDGVDREKFEYECLFGMTKKIKLRVDREIQPSDIDKDTFKQLNLDWKNRIVEMKYTKDGQYEI